MRMRQIGLLITIAAEVALSGCGGGGAVCPPTYAPDPFCAFPSGVQPQMIYPIPGSTGVSDTFNVQGIVLADRSGANYDNPVGYYVAWFGPESTEAAFENDDAPVMLGSFYPISAAQVPQPAATPDVPNPVYEASDTMNGGMPNPIQPHTHYYMYLQYFWKGISPHQCEASGPVGDFTTQ
jgi:hypothetical protein